MRDTFLRHLALEEFKFGNITDMLVQNSVITFQDHGNVCSKTDQTFDKNWASPTESKHLLPNSPLVMLFYCVLKSEPRMTPGKNVNFNCSGCHSKTSIFCPLRIFSFVFWIDSSLHLVFQSYWLASSPPNSIVISFLQTFVQTLPLHRIFPCSLPYKHKKMGFTNFI